MTATPKETTRASFVRGLPEDMPLEEVIERGREAGLDVKPSDVHAARWYMRQGKPRYRIKPKADEPASVTVKEVVSQLRSAAEVRPTVEPERQFEVIKECVNVPANDLVAEFKALVVRLGTERSKRLIERVAADFGG